MCDYTEGKGLIFNIVRSSFVDGWGIRTTIFLKGCPLRCVWCCNPEGQSLAPQLRVTYSDCDGCGDCVSACKRGALAVTGGRVKVDRTLCDGCGGCRESCLSDALGIYGQWDTAREMFGIVRKDETFYRSSGGGVTIGGGEATLYPEFCLGLIELCHEAGIHVAVDTCGQVGSELGMEVLRRADLLLYDVKGLDDVKHRRFTGVSNTGILENLRTLSSEGVPVIVRLPVIPGYNDSDEELAAAREFLAELPSLKRLDILPVHQYGKSKYEELDMEYGLRCEKIPDERQKKILELFKSAGLNAQLGG